MMEISCFSINKLHTVGIYSGRKNCALNLAKYEAVWCTNK